jgi:ADP-ribose pyrophosphatase YjhB (NUDIX family)
MAEFARILFGSVQNDTRFLCLAQNSSGKVLWNFPGGKVEPGETASDAAVREAREELGLSCNSEQLQLISRKRVRLDGKEWVGFFYLCICSAQKYEIREQNKITEVRYLTLEEMKNYPALHSVFSDVARLAACQLMGAKRPMERELWPRCLKSFRSFEKAFA